MSIKSFFLSWCEKRKDLLQWSSCFFTGISFLCILLGLNYVTVYSLPKQGIALVYTFAAFVGHFGCIGFLPWLGLVVPLLLFFPSRRFITGVSVVTASFLLGIILLDSLVFRQNRFHFNVLTIRILEWKTWGFGIFYFFIFTAFTSFFAREVWNRSVLSRMRIPGLAIALCLILLQITTHVMHAWADANYYTPVTRFTPYLPFFYPATAKRFMENNGFVVLKQSREEQMLSSVTLTNSGDLHYPLKPLQFLSGSGKDNVIFIIIDDMRYDVLREPFAKNLMRYARENTVFENHLSGGNSTRMGMFSLFYGIPSTYWQYVEGIHRSPVLLDRCIDQNYATGIFSSSPLFFPASLDRTIFSGIKNLRTETNTPSGIPWLGDSAITSEWFSWMDHRDTARPFFGFLFYNALCGQSYPPQYQSLVSYPDTATSEQERFTRYTVALRYVDSLAGLVLEDLYKRGLSDKTVVIVTTDHGEEFNENGLGFTGHGTACSRAQTHVPLIVHWPGKPPSRISKRTSHNDIPATLMTRLFGCRNSPGDFCSGNDLFSEKQWEWLIVGSYYNYGIIEPEQVTIQFPGGYFEIRDTAYRIIEKPRVNRPVLTEAFREIGRFFNIK